VWIYVSESGASWVEILNGVEHEGIDMDCVSRRTGLAIARRECKRLGLQTFEEVRTHSIKQEEAK
jgi:hypothetical protein